MIEHQQHTVHLRNDVSQYYFDSCYQLITSNMKQVNTKQNPLMRFYRTKETYYSVIPVNAAIAMSLFKKKKGRGFLHLTPGSSTRKLSI